MDVIVTDETKEAIQRFKYAIEGEKKNRERALEADKFCDLEQWPEQVKKAREEEGRPCLTIDKTNQYVKQVCNDQRQNRPSIRVRPVDDHADIETAKVYNGIIRHIESNSRADIAYDRAFEQTARGGYGYFRIITDYCDPMAFDQEILIKSIRNRFAVYLDPSHQEPEASDIEWGFVTEMMRKDEYKKLHDGSDSEWGESGLGDQKAIWYDEHSVRIAEYFYFKSNRSVILLLEDGTVLTEKAYLSEMNEKDFDRNAWKPTVSGGIERKAVVKDRKTDIRSVKWEKISGQRVLEKRDWPGIWIPLIKVIGNEIDIEGEPRLSGMVRPAMDSCKMFNYSASAYVEMVALAPKAPWVAAAGQIEDNQQDWADANRKNISVLTYKPITIDGTLVDAPQRQPMPGIPAGWAQSMNMFEEHIQGNMGIYKAALGAPSNETSGKAIIAKQKEADSSNFNYVDNLTRSMTHAGRILLDLIPRIYDRAKVQRILGEDGNADMAYLNPEQKEAYVVRQGPDGKKKKSYNLSVGKYDVTITVGPAYSTRREESAQAMVQVTQAYPELMRFAGDILFRNLDWPGAEEVSERMKKLLPPALQGDDDDQQLKQLAQSLQQAQQQLEQMGLALKEQEGKQIGEYQLKNRELDIKEYDAQTKRMEIVSDEKIAEMKIRLDGLQALVDKALDTPLSATQ